MGEESAKPESEIERLKRFYLTDMRGNEIGDTLEKKFAHLAFMLSPENLSCDGELSRSAIDKKYRELSKVWAALEKEYGRKVDEDEAFKWGA
jgi:hypothetical protein